MQSRIVASGIFLLFSALTLPAPLLAQYMYIDANGDGVHNAADVMNTLGTPAAVDVWLDRTHNRDGSPATCDTDGDLATWNAYAVHINVANGTVAFSGFTNQVAPFTIPCISVGTGFLSNDVGMAACMATGSPLTSLGPDKLFTVTVTGLTGTPSLQIVPTNGLDQNPTAFGTQCSGMDYDNTYKLGSDWFNADGLAGGGCDFGCPPTLNPVQDMTVDEGAGAGQLIYATDPDGNLLFFYKAAGPSYMTVNTLDAQAGTGIIQLEPGYSDATDGTPGSVGVSDGTHFATRSFKITVRNVNRAPVADAGGPYSGVPNVPIAFDGTKSSDPDGDALSYEWIFGDGKSAVGPTPAHVYAAAGSYEVILLVSDGKIGVGADAIATITDVFEARAFTTRANRVVRLSSGKPDWTIQIEPVAHSFDIGNVGPGTIRLKSTGTGSVSEIGALLSKTSLQGDADGNGVPDIAAAFAKADLQALFSNLSGSTSVPVTLEGSLTSGGIFRAQADIGVVASGKQAAMIVIPNPLNPSGEVSFGMEKPGRVRVELFDVSGRRVRVLADGFAETGIQRVAIDGRNQSGAPLASGVYYLRASTPDGVQTRRVAVVK